MRFILALTFILATVPALEAAPQWFNYRPHPDRVYLYDGDRNLGYWDLTQRHFRPLNPSGVGYGPAANPPVPFPGSVQNFGVQRDQIGDRERFYRGGQEIPREQFMQGIGDDRLPDDTGFLRLTVIGPEAQRAQVVADLANHQALAPWRGRLVINSYAPDHWAVQPGFVTTGTPTVYVQKPDGAVLHRQNDYQGGADGLAAALRRVDPNYRPPTDPDARRTPASPSATVPTWLWVVGGLAVLLLFTSRKEGK
jgi:hypothetical protein